MCKIPLQGYHSPSPGFVAPKLAQENVGLGWRSVLLSFHCLVQVFSVNAGHAVVHCYVAIERDPTAIPFSTILILGVDLEKKKPEISQHFFTAKSLMRFKQQPKCEDK